MTATTKSRRTPPVNRFEDYVLTYEVGPNAGLYPINNEAMTYVEGFPGNSSTDDSYGYIDLNFIFKFDQKEYRKIFITTNGWAALVDEANDPGMSVPYGMSSQVLTGGAMWDNEAIKDSFSNTKHIMLCPWFDDIRNIARKADSTISAYLAVEQVTIDEIKYGKKITPPGIDESSGGMKYFRGQTRERGKCLIIRWKSFARYTGQYNVINFDLALYESGDIEFRYAPRLLLKQDTNEGATIGIFANGESVSKPRYRDMSIFLRGNEVDSRGKYENGGAVYDGSYTDPITSTKYNASLDTFSNWPGLGQFGAVFKLSPPSLKRRQLRSVVSLRDSVSFFSEGAFDDRNTQIFSQQVVEYPSMMPVLAKVENESDQPQAIGRLFQSGSIRVTRVVKHGLYDPVLSDSIIETRVKF